MFPRRIDIVNNMIPSYYDVLYENLLTKVFEVVDFRLYGLH